MFVTRKSLPRRTFLKGAGTALAADLSTVGAQFPIVTAERHDANARIVTGDRSLTVAA